MPEIVQLFADSPVAFSCLIFVIGLIIGSFLNVVIHRLPIMMEQGWKQEYQSYFNTDESHPPSAPTYNLVKPDSTCPQCGHLIRAWENVPVLSWLWLKGKCSQCSSSISMRYPLVELATGLVSLAVAIHFGFTWQCLAALCFSWLLIAMTFIDIDKMLLPDQLTLPLLWVGLILSLNDYFVSSQDAIIGAAVGYLSLWSLYWAFKLTTGKEGMGYGDFKLLAALGAWLGWQQLPIVILLSSFVGAIIGVAQLSIQGKDKSQPIPFGPYLAIAGWITLLYGTWISDTYWQWILA